jgi:hypothetical protein
MVEYSISVKKGQTVFVQVKVLASFLPDFALRAKSGRKEEKHHWYGRHGTINAIAY